MPASEVAQIGDDAMMKGEGDVVAGWQNELQAAIAHITPADALASMHEGMANPGTAKHRAPAPVASDHDVLCAPRSLAVARRSHSQRAPRGTTIARVPAR